MKQRGVIYVAIGEKYLKEISNSLESLRRYMPDLSVTIFTDQVGYEEKNTKFVYIKENKPPKIIRIECLNRSDYEITMYLDADTLIQNDFLEVFDLLKEADLAVSNGHKKVLTKYPNIDQDILLMNCGVLLYKNTDAVREFFNSWLENYKTYLDLETKDEPSFYFTLLKERIDFIVCLYDRHFCS